MPWLNKDSYGTVLICEDCFGYSKFNDQWEYLVKTSDWRCDSCGREFGVIVIRARHPENQNGN